MLKRWLAFLLLLVFCLHTLPVLETAVDACAWIAEDGGGDCGEEDGGEAPLSPVKKDAAPFWCGTDETTLAAQAHFDEEVAAALHDASMRLPAVERKVVVPPPDALA